MNMMINTLEFAEAFEAAGFDHEKAKALASAFGRANEAGREDLATKNDLAIMKSELMEALARQHAALTKVIAENGKDLSGRLWSTITIIAGVSTAISATIGAGVALMLRSGGL